MRYETFNCSAPDSELALNASFFEATSASYSVATSWELAQIASTGFEFYGVLVPPSNGTYYVRGGGGGCVEPLCVGVGLAGGVRVQRARVAAAQAGGQAPRRSNKPPTATHQTRSRTRTYPKTHPHPPTFSPSSASRATTRRTCGSTMKWSPPRTACTCR